MKSLTTLKSTLLFVCTASDTSVSGWTSSYSRVNPRRRRFHRSSHLSMQDLVNDDTKINPPLEPSESSNSFSCDERYPGGEVVGSTGKIGSFLLHRLNQQSSRFFDASRYPQSLNVAATPRGVAPGCLSPPNTPIYACIPSSSIQDVWESTVPHRRDDLVFICNCVPSRHLSFGGSEENDEENSDFSVVIPHFGVPHIRPSSERISLTPVVHTSATSPPTVIYGKHADSLAKLLRNDDIPVQIVRSSQGIQVAAVRKLIWASLMWLICHDNGDSSPLTVKEAHEKKVSDLERLVEEILPSLKMLSVEAWTNREGLVKGEESHKEYISIGTVETIVEYLKAYSMSLSDGNVTPSKDLAMVEIHERNMLFIALKLMTACTSENLPSDFHTDMICRVIGQEKFQKCLEDVSATKNISRKATRIQTSQRVRFVSSDLEFLVHPTKIDKNTLLESESGVDKSVVIVGAGMVGSSIAYHLSQQPGIQVTVLDQKCNILPNTPDEIIDPGIATSSTFAWLNANDKSPLSYMHLNKMGMESWRRHVLLKDLPVWCGSIVRKKCLQDVEIDVEKILFTEKNKSHYSRIGPLTAEEVSRLEPGVAFKSPTTKATDDATSTENQNEEIYFYPEEGHVNPASAVKLLRQAANSNGVKFVGGIQLQELMRDNINGKINGVKIKRQGSDNLEVMSADIVVISAGANSSEPILGIGSDRLPLLYQPGALAYVQSASSGIDVDKRLKRIVVDTISQSHILRRRDGTLLIGGGQLVVGGSEDLTLERQSSDSLMSNETELDDKLVGEKMIESVASNIAPLELLTAEAKINRDAVKISRANRPMPSDGLPVVGAIESGLYVTVSHSAMTLGLVLGELSAHEILRIVQGYDQPDDEKLYGFKIFDSYRPHRFWRRDS